MWLAFRRSIKIGDRFHEIENKVAEINHIL